MYIGQIPTPTATESRQEFTATSGQTEFQTTGGTEGYCDCFLNGVKLDSRSDFSFDGSTVRLTTGAAAGDVLAVVMRQADSALVALPIKDSAGNNVLSESGSVVTLTADEANVGSNALVVNSSKNVGVGTSSPAKRLSVSDSSTGEVGVIIRNSNSATNGQSAALVFETSTGTEGHESSSAAKIAGFRESSGTTGSLRFYTTNAGTSEEHMRITSNGWVLVGKSTDDFNTDGSVLYNDGSIYASKSVAGSVSTVFWANRITSDGDLIRFSQAGIQEGSISVSGTTVSYNGGHLARWSQLPDSSKDETIVKGTVMTNLDAMCEWSHPDEYWTEEDEIPVDEEGNPTAAVGNLKKAAYTEDNEQLNRMVVSSVEGDPNVAGVFVNWDNDDEQFNDMNIAMTGDMVIRIAQGVTVARGDLLMSAGDGTAKPQGDDIVRSKTIAKVTSTHISHTYEDGSYLVPCVLMAC